MNLKKVFSSLILSIISLFLWAGFCFAEDLLITVMDVGQADSILLQTAGKTVLIDAGEEKNQVKELLKQKGIRNIDLVVGTHPHADHIGGMQQVVENTDIKVYMDNGFPSTTNMYSNLMESVEAKVTSGQMKYIAGRQGMRLNFGPEAHFDILWPDEQGIWNTRSDANANSVVMKLTHGDVCFLFMGDSEAETEKLVADQINEKCHVLKISHHGSPHSSIPEFLDKVQPDVALISCGLANKHGHPGRATLDALKQRNAQTYRTDWMGEIKVVSDGKTVSVATEKNLTLADLPCIDINNDPITAFAKFKGVGKVTTDQIEEARDQHGPFETLDDLLKVLPQKTAHRLEKMSDYLSTDCSARMEQHGIIPKVIPQLHPPVFTKININTESVAKLTLLPGIDNKKAQAISDYRMSNGAFANCQALSNVSGISNSDAKDIAKYCTTQRIPPRSAYRPHPVLPKNRAKKAIKKPAYSAPKPPVQSAIKAPPAAKPAAGAININTADAAAIAQMPGMTPKRADAVIDYRNNSGRFSSCNDLQKVKGIGPKTVEKLLSVCTVD